MLAIWAFDWSSQDWLFPELGFPVLKGLTWSNKRTPKFTTVIQTSGAASQTGARETRLGFQDFPTWKYEYVYNYLYAYSDQLTFSDLNALEGIFLAARGMLKSFLYTDPERFAAVGQPLRITDVDGITYSQLLFSIKQVGGPTWFDDMVTDLNPLDGSGLVVYDNGVAMVQGTDYLLVTGGVYGSGVSLAGVNVRWSGHTPTGPVTADFQYYHRCRFSTDESTFEEFMNLLWKNGSVSFETVFDNA